MGWPSFVSGPRMLSGRSPPRQSSRGTGCTRRRPAPSGADSNVIAVEVSNRSGVEVDEAGATALARSVLEAEGVEEGEVGLLFVDPAEIRSLKHAHLGVDEATDVLSFPIDGRESLPGGVPRQLGDAVLCPQVVGEAWRQALGRGLLHLLGSEPGPEMEAKEQSWRAWSVRGGGE